VLALGVGVLARAAAEQPEAVAPAAGALVVGRTELGGEGRRLSRELAGLHLPGGTAAGHGLVLLGGADLALGHAGVEIPALVVLARVPLTEVVEVVQPLARLGGARRRGRAAVRPLAGLLAWLEVEHVGLGRLLFGAGRLDAHVLE